jgi:hypothetical protein
MYDILLLTNFTLLTADMILLCTKNLYVIHDSHSPFHRKMYILLLVWCHLRPIRPTVLSLKLNFISRYLQQLPWANQRYTYFWQSVLNLISTFFRLGCLSKESVQIRSFLWSFVTSIFLRWGVVARSLTLKLEDHPLSAVRECLFNIFAATLHTWRASPHSAAWWRVMHWWQGTHLT